MKPRSTFLILIAALSMASPLRAADTDDLAALASWVALDAPTGHEHHATAPLLRDFAAWRRDRYGNLTRTIGTGRPHRVVACALDALAYSVSEITEEGYLRLHRIGEGSAHPLWDQAHEGQQLRVLTAHGPLVAVSAVTNGHFASQHRNQTAVTTQNELWLDVGASSASDVAEMGIELLDPVVRQLPAWSYASEVAGPRAGARAGCAVVLAAAEAGVNSAVGSTSYVLSVQQAFGWTGLSAALRWLPPADSLVLVAPGEMKHRNEAVASVNRSLDAVLKARNVRSIRVVAPRVADPGALMERIELAAAEELLAAVTSAVDASAGLPAWRRAAPQAAVVNSEPQRAGPRQRDRLAAIEGMLDGFAELVAVPRHEGPVRQRVLDGLPAWARERVQRDEIGNVWVEFGAAQGEATVFMAHMDEVAWEIDAIAPDGTARLKPLGGVVATAWEGQPAVLQLDTGALAASAGQTPLLRGVFLARHDATTRHPDTVSAWFGMDAAQLAAVGVRPGAGLTLYKEGHRVGAYRYAARSMDDRVGVTALLTALGEIDPDLIPTRVVFAWTVQEEIGLFGATSLATRYGDESRRVYSIDTFVSSDTPLESPHFAHAPLGEGPVLRSIESSSMATPAELARNRRIASDAGIVAQVGHTQGGTDGTALTFWGAPNAGLSWPGRYSHSPAEIADLRDIAGLVDLIKAMAAAPH